MTSFLIYIFLGLGLITLLISKSKFFIPMLIVGLLIGSSHLVTKNLGKLKSMVPSSTKTESNQPKGLIKEPTPPEWETVGNYPIQFTGRVFSNTVGPNGERAKTGEVFSGCILETGYTYKITLSGDYSQYFTHDPWYDNIGWSGWTPQIHSDNRPFKHNHYGALMLRIGNKEGLKPVKDNFIVFIPTENARVFGELNITRESDNYSDPKIGSKIKNSTLSLKIERRPI